jgi:hypothetical protein
VKEAEMGKMARSDGQAGVAGMSEADLEALVERTRAGAVVAWRKLWLELEPEVWRAAGRPRALGSLARDEDEVRAVGVHVMGELCRDDYRLLGTLSELLARRDGSWQRWLWTISTNAARNHVRDRADCLGRDEEGNPRLAVYTEPPDEPYDVRRDPSVNVDAHRILDEAPALLTTKQMDALAGWLEGQDGDERSGTPAEATRLVRSGVMRLRRHYARERCASAPADAPAKARLPRRARTER